MVLKYSIALCLFGCAVLAAQPAMTCRVVETPAASIRAEGLNELLSDVLIACTGGSPVSTGTVPQYQLLVISNTPLNLRMVPPPKPPTSLIVDGPLQPPMALTDALAVLDEPAALDQRPCVPVAPANHCPVDARSSTRPNVFQGTCLLYTSDAADE